MEYPESRAEARERFGETYKRREARRRYRRDYEISWEEANALWPDLPPASDEAEWGE